MHEENGFNAIDVAQLSRADAAEMLAQVKALEGRLLARLLTAQGGSNEARKNGDGDRLLTVEQACDVLACSKSWLYHHHKRLAVSRKLGDGSLRFPASAIQRLLKQDGRKLRRVCESQEP